MITVSEKYRKKINADFRNIKPRVLVYLEGDTAPPTVFDHEKIVNLQLLEEAGADSDNPIGYVTSNELSITFNNVDNVFTPTNQESPYYGKLRPNIRVDAFISVEIEPDVYEEVPLGIFWTGDWNAPSDQVEATVTCYDRLYNICNCEMPMVRVARDTTIKGMFETLFATLGLDPGDYVIDHSLNQSVKIGWFPDGQVRDALQLLAIAGNCYVKADRHGVIRVKSNFAHGNPVAMFTDDDQIINCDNPQRYLNIYNKVKVSHYYPYIKESDSLLKITSLIIPSGGTILKNIKFSNGPVVEVEKIQMNAKNVEIISIEYGAWSITLEFANNGSEETIDIEVFGRTVDSTKSTYEAHDQLAVKEWGEKELSIDNHLIQSLEMAKTYADAMLNLVKDPFINFVFDLRGDPAIEIGDIVKIVDNADKIGEAIVVPIRITLTYDGGLGAKMEARKPVIPYQWTFLSPGFYAYVPYAVFFD